MEVNDKTYNRPKRVRKFNLKNKVCDNNVNPFVISKTNIYELWVAKFGKYYGCDVVK